MESELLHQNPGGGGADGGNSAIALKQFSHLLRRGQTLTARIARRLP